MTYFISFIYGTTLFYVYKFFPFISLFISLTLIALLVFNLKFRKHQSACHSHPRKSATFWRPLCEEQSDPSHVVARDKVPKQSRLFGAGSAISFLLRLLRLRLAMTKVKTFFHVFVIVITAAAGFYYARLLYVPATSISDIAGETIELRGVPNSEAVPLDSKSYQDVAAFSQRIEIREPENLRELRLISNRVLFSDRIYHINVQIPKDAYSLNPGSSHNILSGYAVEIKDAGSNPNGFFKRLRIRLNDFMKRKFSPESAPFLMSIITGERSLLTKETRDAFNVTGLAHILSISGAHFGLLLFILFRLFRILVKALPYNMLVRLTLYLTPSQITAILCIPFMIGYLGISDMSIPAIRSFIMITLFLSSLLIHRKGFWLNTLLFAAVVIILIQPDSVLDLSFQLSFIAVLCIGMVVEKIEDKRLRGSEDKEKTEVKGSLTPYLLNLLTSSFVISLAATIGTAPLVAYYFHYFSLVSPITNLIITPVIGFVILPLSLVSSFVFLVSGIFPFVSFIDAITIFVLSVIKHVAQWSFVDIKIPAFPTILLVMFYLGILVYLIIEQKSRRAEGLTSLQAGKLLSKELLLSTTIAVIPIILYSGIKLLEPRGIKITYLDVGQGDAAVIELPDNKTLVIDTGRKGFQVAGFLRYRGIKKIDAIVLSHGQSDHAGGIGYLLRNFNVREIWDNGRLVYPEEFLQDIKHRGFERGDIIEGSGYKIYVLHPYKGFYTMYSDDNDENNDSVVLKIQGIHAFLFTGDVEEEALDDLSHLGAHLKSTVLKIPHHGSRTSISEIFFSAASPEIAVISAGRSNAYGHPHDETMNMLNNIRVFRTDRDGAVGIKELPNGRLDVKTWKEFQFEKAKTVGDELMNLKKLFWVW